eukprot:TRINITY_DN190_c0_g1_i1.p1 TRINITY_DN190_c0_g1~~TRINITY_DN190_c0_g1_i1.p1  ORF type:complete len:377 (-),score=63.33 TRINITY_DN190_c0_g1_i1:44-1174(-)
MVAEFWVYGLVMAPMSILIGIATATIGFTAWGIVVPLVWIGLGGGEDDGWMYYALFTSIFMDFVNGLCLTAIYAVQDKVHWKKGALFGLPACGIAIGCIFASKVALEFFKDEIKKGLGYMVIVIGISFVIRGYGQWKKQKAALEETPGEDQGLLPGSQGSTFLHKKATDDGELSPENASQAVHDWNSSRPQNNDEVGCIGVISGPIVPSTPTPVRKQPEPAVVNTADLDEVVEEEAWTVAWIIRYTLMILITTVSSVLSGLLGMGSGTNFVLAFLYLMKFDLLMATGTGVLIMTGLMFSMTLCYLLGAMPAVYDNIDWLWPYFVLPSCFGLIGTVMGAFFSLRFSPLKMNFVIAFLLVGVGLIAVVEPYIIHAVDG